MPCIERAKDLASKRTVDEVEGEDGWVIAESKGAEGIVDIDGGEEEKKSVPEEELVADIDDESDDDDNVFAKKAEVVEDNV